MKSMFTLLLLAVGSLCLGCAGLQDVLLSRRPEARLTGIGFEKITLKSAQLRFDLEVDNPYPADLPLLNLDYQVTSQANKLFSGQTDVQTSIPAKSSQVINLPVELSYLDLYRAFKDIRQGSKIPYEADLGLLVNPASLGQIRLPIRKSGELQVPEIPSPSDVDWKKLLEKVP